MIFLSVKQWPVTRIFCYVFLFFRQKVARRNILRIFLPVLPNSGPPENVLNSLVHESIFSSLFPRIPPNCVPFKFTNLGWKTKPASWWRQFFCCCCRHRRKKPSVLLRKMPSGSMMSSWMALADDSGASCPWIQSHGVRTWTKLSVCGKSEENAEYVINLAAKFIFKMRPLGKGQYYIV